jgi:hypothetical protein
VTVSTLFAFAISPSRIDRLGTTAAIGTRPHSCRAALGIAREPSLVRPLLSPFLLLA